MVVQKERMDNAGYLRDVEQRGAALEMKVTTKGISANNKKRTANSPNNGNNNNMSTTIDIDSTPVRPNVDRPEATEGIRPGTNYPKLLGGSVYNNLPSTSCRPEVCQAARRRYAPPDLSGSPWHRYKTIFLLLTLILLALWIIIYATLNSLKIL